MPHSPKRSSRADFRETHPKLKCYFRKWSG